MGTGRIDEVREEPTTITHIAQGEGSVPAKPCTIRDVAEAAGVSLKTVSRVVNRENYVAETTRKRVETVIRELGYYPHTGAQSLRAERRDSVGVTFSAPLQMVPISEQLLSYLFSTLYRLFGSNDVVVSFDFSPSVATYETDYARGLWSKRHGGLVILGPLREDDPVIPRVHGSGLPYLTTSRMESLPDCSSCAVDLEEAAYVSAKHLLERGHRRVAMLTSFEGYHAGEERRRGYARALGEAGVEVDDSLIRGATFASHEISALVHRLLMDPKVTGLIDCSACEDAAGIREGAERAGRTIGDDADVVCWTYTHKASVLSEACAHVWLPLREALTEGLEDLAGWFSGRSKGPVSVLYRPTLYETRGLEEMEKPRPVFNLSA